MIEKTIEIPREGIVITQRDSRVSWGKLFNPDSYRDE
jgi:hypothetical protein